MFVFLSLILQFIMPSRPTLWQMTGFPCFFMVEWYSITYLYLYLSSIYINLNHIFFIHSSINGHLVFPCLEYCKQCSFFLKLQNYDIFHYFHFLFVWSFFFFFLCFTWNIFFLPISHSVHFCLGNLPLH